MLTTEQREIRRKYVGSSDIAAILGMSPWRTAYDVWLDKTGKLLDQNSNDSQAMGTRLEPVILDWAQDQIGKPIIRDTQFISSNGIMIASLDGLIEYGDHDEHAEAKYSTMADEWGEAGTDEIPDGYLLQIAHQFACLPDSVMCHVPCMLIVGRKLDMRMYHVPRNNDLVDVVTEAACNFWTRYVKTDTPPEDSAPSVDVVKLVRRTAGKSIVIENDLPAAYLEAKAAYKAAEDAYEEAKDGLLVAMGDAEEAETPMGRFTYRRQSRAGWDGDKLKSLPDWKSYQKFSTFPVLREPKQK